MLDRTAWIEECSCCVVVLDDSNRHSFYANYSMDMVVLQ